MSNPNSITITTNHWRVPSAERALDGWLEGSPTEAEKLQVIAQAEAARAAWAPSTEAMALVEQLKAFIGSRVQIEFWDSCMWMFPEEGPYPLVATIQGVVLLQVGEHLQAYLEVSSPIAVPTSDGYDPMVFLLKRPESSHQLAPLSELYSVAFI